MSLLKLNNDDLLGIGGQRECYLHPINKSKVLKIMYRCNSSKDDVNKLEYYYMKILERRNVSFEHLSKCDGFVATNKGKALIFERVVNFNGKPSISFREAIKNKKISYSIQETLLSDLYCYLRKEAILFIDYELSNIFLKEISEGKYKLIIIDGLGAKRFNYKFWFYSYFLLYTKYKIERQWERFLEIYYFERELLSCLKQGSRKKIDYSKLELFKKTSSKEIYFYPYDKRKILKISFQKKKNLLNEYLYYSYLIKNKKNMNFLPKCYGIQLLVDRRKTVVFDLVLDLNGQVSKNLISAIKSEVIREEKLLDYFLELLNTLEKNEIYTKHLKLEKILCQETKPLEYELKIISGLGDKKSSITFWLFKNISFYRKYFLKKEIKRLKNSFLSLDK